MSIIPKIKVGRPDKRERLKLSFDCLTTSNIGAVQPTMCREMVPNETFKVSVSSLVRLASMPLPTFGRMSLRHYHVFVPYSQLYEPFTAMLSGQQFTDGEVTFVPGHVPYILPSSLVRLMMQYADMTIVKTANLDEAVTITGANDEEIAAAVAAAKTVFDTIFVSDKYLFAGTQSYNVTDDNRQFLREHYQNTYGSYKSGSGSEDKGVINFGDFAYIPSSINDTFTINTDSNPNGALWATPGTQVITPEGADYITAVDGTDYSVLFKLKPIGKHFRTIVLGLGYALDPYHGYAGGGLYYNPLKLLAFYKAWFNLMRPVREVSFTNTNCYKVVKFMTSVSAQGTTGNYLGYTNIASFLEDLAHDCYYYLPMDYFSMALTNPNQQMGEGVTIESPFTLQSGTVKNGSVSSTDTGVIISSVNGGVNSPLIQKIAQRLLTFANKNTVVGRSIRDYIRVHYGVYEDSAPDSMEVYRIGANRVDISISDVMSTAESSQGYLGEYGGKGIGYKESEQFDFTAKEFGCWITLTCVVPESGYYQGYLAENTHVDRYHFFMPEFDAVGYQVLQRGEVMSDWNCDRGSAWNPRTAFDPKGAFGFVPRFSEYKVGRNILNGDLSLIGLYNSMAPYSLERRFPAGSIVSTKVGADGVVTGKKVVAPTFVPSVVFDKFRRIDPSDRLGQYNRIFNYGLNDLDHFMIFNVFDVDAIAPMKSLSTSFDTNNNDGDTIEVTHA